MIYSGRRVIHIPVTVMQLDRCQVVGQRTALSQTDMTALQLGAGAKKAKRVNKAERG